MLLLLLLELLRRDEAAESLLRPRGPKKCSEGIEAKEGRDRGPDRSSTRIFLPFADVYYRSDRYTACYSVCAVSDAHGAGGVTD